jgi:dUTP pyrophosphatase
MSDDPVTTFQLGPKCRALIPTGMVLDIPAGFSGRIHPRSGNAWKNGVTLINAEGVIDSDYCNELLVPLYNTTNIPFVITHGDRIAQLEITKPYNEISLITYTEAKPKNQKTNRKGGFGSTGV